MKDNVKVTQKEYILLLKFIRREILTGVDPALRRAVESMFKENSRLLDRVVELGGKELAKDFWGKLG